MQLMPNELARVVGATMADAVKYCAFLNMASKSGVINTLDRNAMFLAQLTHESQHLACVEENLSYSTQRLIEVWPGYFPTISAAAPYAHNPQALANRVYGGRLGNIPGTGDGWTYRGRGLIQITGRQNYAIMMNELKIDLLTHPEMAAEPKIAVAIAVCFWIRSGCNTYADQCNVTECTRAINGALVGLADRAEMYAIVKAKLCTVGPQCYEGV